MLPERFLLDSFAIYGSEQSRPTAMLSDEEKHRVVERRFWIISAVISFFTLFLTIFAVVAAFKAYIATQIQADAAQKQLNDNELPNISVSKLQAVFVNEKANSTDVQVNPVIKNSGTLPLRDLSYKAVTKLCASNAIPPGFFPEAGFPNEGNHIGLNGLQESTRIIRHTFKEKERSDITSGSLRGFSYGTITYRDSSNSEEHHMRYCFGITAFPSDEDIKNKGPIELTDIFACGQNSNCVDEACGDIHEQSKDCPGPDKR